MHLLWFRRDLRLTDNEIVTLATGNDARVLHSSLLTLGFIPGLMSELLESASCLSHWKISTQISKS